MTAPLPARAPRHLTFPLASNPAGGAEGRPAQPVPWGVAHDTGEQTGHLRAHADPPPCPPRVTVPRPRPVPPPRASPVPSSWGGDQRRQVGRTGATPGLPAQTFPRPAFCGASQTHTPWPAPRVLPMAARTGGLAPRSRRPPHERRLCFRECWFGLLCGCCFLWPFLSVAS